MTKKTLMVKDLLEGEFFHSNGFGLYKHEVRQVYTWRKSSNPYAVIKMIDKTIIDVANYLNLSAIAFQNFMDSKMGRYAGDAIISEYPPDNRTVEQVIKKYMKQYMVAEEKNETKRV